MRHVGKERISPLNAHELDERDPAYRENYAVLELLRSLSIGKMVTVVGSGVTTIYGYMNWEDFISSLIEDFRKWAQSEDLLDSRGRQIFDGIYANYKNRDRDDKNTSTEHIAVLGELVESLTDKGKEEYLENLRIYFTQKNVITMDAVAERYRSLLEITEANVKEKRPLPADVSGLLALMPGSSQAGTVAGSSSAVDANSNSSSRIRKPRNIIDPLIRIRKELDISRFVTFNYDLELEKMLEDLDYPFGSLSGKKSTSETALTAQSRIGAIGKSISLTEENASELIALAAMPTAANDVIVHVHGSIGNPEKMIVTQRDYNQRYFDAYPGRETFEDAQSLLFGGNSVIYAGVGLSEEDLMKPLRYLRSNDKKRPIFALLPVLTTEERARSTAMRVWTNYGINVILYGRSEDNIPSAWKELPDLDHPLGGSFISLGQELKYLEKTKKLNGEKWIKSIKELVVEKRNIPRLTSPIDGFSGKNYICSLISGLNEADDKQHFSKQNVAKIVDYLKLLAISIALDNVIVYMRRAASAWQDKMAGAEDSNKPLPVNYGCTSITEQIKDKIQDPIYKGGKRFKDIWRLVKTGKVTALHLSRGRGKGTFATFLRLYCKEKNIHSRFISLDRTMRVRTVLTDVIDRMDEFELICIQNADFLLDSSTKSAKTISMQKFIERLDTRFDTDGNYRKKKVLLIFRSESAARSVCKERNNFDLLPPKGAADLRIHEESMLRKDVCHKEHAHLHKVLERHHWPNILLSGLLDELCGIRGRLGSRSPLLEQVNSKRKSFIASCEQAIRKRTFGTSQIFEQAIFCDAILEESHIFVQNSDGEEHRIIHVIQNIIIKWMYAIYIPFEKGLLHLIPEIAKLQHTDSYNFSKDKFDSLINKTWERMIKCGIIYRVESSSSQSANDDMPKDRCVLHGSVRRYLAHKRGLSLEKADNRELNSVSLSPVLIDGGPMLSSGDYLATRELFDSLVNPDSSSKDRLRIRSAYALMRGNLYAQSAMRAGIAYSTGKPNESILHAHVRRLSRLRTASENQLRSASEKNSNPALYAHDRIWLLNEIGVVRYIQGNFHDCVLLFRQALKSVSENQYLKDDTIKSRININLSLALIERGRFEDAQNCLQSAEDHLHLLASDGISADDSPITTHPEYVLIQRLIHGCRAQIHYLVAEMDLAKTEVKKAVKDIAEIQTSAARGWLHHIESSLLMATGNYQEAVETRALALANARAAHRHNLILSMEISEVELELRARRYDRETVIRAISQLLVLESNAAKLGSHKIRVSSMLIRARALLTIEQVEPARRCIIGAICLAQHNGMRLKRMSGLILMVALIAMRGERAAAIELLGSVRLSASRVKYAQAMLEIELLEHAINTGSGIPQWAGYVAEYAHPDR